MRRLIPLLLSAGFASFNTTALKGADEATVTLPKVVVTEKSLPPKIESWRYAEIAGYKILSQASDATTRKLIEDLERVPLIVETVWPAPRTLERKPAFIILCREEKTFAGFVPPFVQKAVDPILVDRLFLQDPGQEIIVLKSGPSGDDHRFKEILRDDARRSLLALRQIPPDWFVTGMAEIIADAECSASGEKLTIHYADLSKPKHHGDLPPSSLYETERPSAAVREVIRGSFDNRSRSDLMAEDNDANLQLTHYRFNDYFADHHYHPLLAEVLANKPSVEPDDYRMTCWAFVHLCAFAQKRGYAGPLGKLLRLAAKNPNGDMATLFRDAFHRSPEAMDGALVAYTQEFTSPGAVKKVALSSTPPPLIRDADAQEISQMKEAAYRLGGQPAEAEAELAKIRNHGH